MSDNANQPINTITSTDDVTFTVPEINTLPNFEPLSEATFTSFELPLTNSFHFPDTDLTIILEVTSSPLLTYLDSTRDDTFIL